MHAFMHVCMYAGMYIRYKTKCGYITYKKTHQGSEQRHSPPPKLESAEQHRALTVDFPSAEYEPSRPPAKSQRGRTRLACK